MNGKQFLLDHQDILVSAQGLRRAGLDDFSIRKVVENTIRAFFGNPADRENISELVIRVLNWQRNNPEK